MDFGQYDHLGERMFFDQESQPGGSSSAQQFGHGPPPHFAPQFCPGPQLFASGPQIGSQFARSYLGPPLFTSSLVGQIPRFSATAQFGTYVSSSTVLGSSVTFPIASAPPPHFGLGGALSSPDMGYAGTAPSPSPAPDSVEATVASWSDYIIAYPGGSSSRYPSGGFSSGGQ